MTVGELKEALNEHSSKLYLQIESQVKMFIKRDKENEQ